MTNIEITEDLLRRVLDGDQDAQEEARSLLPKVGNLFGRWATHPEFGRVLIIKDGPDNYGEVLFYRLSSGNSGGTTWGWAPLDLLTLDPVELVTEQDFEEAPEGTIVAQSWNYPREKHAGDWNIDSNVDYSNGEMAEAGTWRVVRWGDGNA